MLCTLLIGCVSHVTLPVPPPTLTAEQRIGWFNSLAGETEKTTTITTCQNLSCSTRIEKEMRLVNGTTIEASEDLLPVVRPDSTTAQHARAARRARDRGSSWAWGSLGAAAAIVLVSSLVADAPSPEDHTLLYAWGAAATVATVGYIVNYVSKAEAVEEDGFAFRAYTKDLADRLNVCVLGYQLVPCEYRPPPPAPSGPPGANEPAPEPPAPQQHVPDGPVARQ